MRALSSYSVLVLALLIASGCGGDDESTPSGMNGGGQGGAGAASGGTGAAGGTSGANGGESGTAGATGGTNATGGSSGASGVNGAGDGGAGDGGGGADAGGEGDGGSGTSGGMDGSISGAGGGDPNVGMLSDAECTLEEPWSCKVCEDQDNCLVPELTNNGDGTISSTCCGHVWQAEPLFAYDAERPNDDCRDRVDDTGCFTWEEAHDYCAGLDLAGGGFRLPEAVEMRTLFVRGMGSPYIDRDAFPNIPTGDLYWTASESELSANEAWCAGFNGTFSGRRQKNTKHLVLCIR